MSELEEKAQNDTAKSAGVSRALFLNLLAGAGVFAAGGFVGKTFFGGNAETQTAEPEPSADVPEQPQPSAETPADTPEPPVEDEVLAWDKEEAGQELLQVGSLNEGSEADPDAEVQPFENVWCTRDDMNIFGLKFVPEGDGPFPAVICSHGITGMCFNFFTYATFLQANGYLVYAFDFCGGNYDDNAQSDGEFIDMTIDTEKDDLKAVLEEVRSWDDVDEDRVFLMGHSQGGLVTSLVAGDNADELAGIVLIAPGFELVDMVRAKYPDYNDIPDMFDMFNTFKVGKAYGQSLWMLDWEIVISRFTKPVLIMHGTKDNVINYRYSVEASENYEDVQIELFPNAAHWLYDDDFDRSCEILYDFLDSVGD